ncbi:hypothetical protein HPB50_004765 [Hyalomma asiaticum]|uniref:Uncharacterized protein n=1 Tax=Hyalomma asiaticum TaxID=266040 RepID=A0ACB7S4N9_HYAAI|nr:hypothetical protein HPB50_004765 [Hyalomma asiaticum]
MPEGEAVIPKDADVAAEWAAVEKTCEHGKGNIGGNVLVARRLHKYYGPLQAVKELSFALKPAECFGLLGVNGAGKTTTFRMLTALTPTTYGEALMKDVVLSEEPRKWQSRIGYCPQGNTFLERLTGYENLYLFGRLRGVPEESLTKTVECIIDITELREHAAKRCDYYSETDYMLGEELHKRFHLIAAQHTELTPGQDIVVLHDNAWFTVFLVH